MLELYNYQQTEQFQQMKRNIEIFKWSGWVLFIICLIVCRCGKEQTEIVIPAHVGDFKPDTQIVHVPVDRTVEVPKWYKDSKKEKELNERNKQLDERIKGYQKTVDSMVVAFHELDSIGKMNAYLEATSLNKFSTEFEDDRIKLFIQGVVRGEVQEITPAYMIKEQKIPIEDLRKRYLLLGGGAGMSTEMNTFTAKMNLSLQNKKGSLYTASFQRIGNQNFGLIEYNFRLTK